MHAAPEAAGPIRVPSRWTGGARDYLLLLIGHHLRGVRERLVREAESVEARVFVDDFTPLYIDGAGDA